MSQANSIKLGNNDVKIKQGVNLNIATKDKQKGSSTFKTVDRKHYSCSHCGSKKHASNDKSCPSLEIMY